MLKKISKSFLSTITLMMLILVFVTMPVFASTSDTLIIHHTNEEIKAMQDAELADKIAALPRADGWEYEMRRVDSVVTEVDTGFAAGQNRDGTTFGSDGGFYWTDGGYNVNVTLNIAYGAFSVSVSRGSTGGTGRWIKSPYIGVPVKLRVYKNVQTTKYAVYKRLKYSGNTWTFSHYDYGHLEVGERLVVERV